MNFKIDPVKACLVFERDGLLVDAIDETSPLRRLASNDESNAEIPIYWDSRDLEKRKKTSPQPSQKKNGKLAAPEFIFVARKGSSFDGHSLVHDVLSGGNIFVGEPRLVEAHLKKQDYPKEWVSGVINHPYNIKVRSTEQSLSALLEAACQLSPQNFTTVAVTGTNGKTSVTQITGNLLSEILKKDVLRLGTLGIQIGAETREGNTPTMPDFPGFLEAVSIANNKGITHIVLEATSHGLTQHRLGNWTTDVAIFTNLTQDHLDYHKTMEAYRDAKALLFERHVKHGGAVVVNTDDPEWIYFCMRAAHPYRNCIGVGRGANKKEFFAAVHSKFLSTRYLTVSHRHTLRTGIQGVWTFENEKTKIAEANFSCNLIGSFQHENLSFSAATLLSLGYPLSQIAQAVTHVKSIPGRLELVPPTPGGPTVLVDYAHSPDAIEKTLLTCRELKGKTGKLICVFGCGGDRDRDKRPKMGGIAAKLADFTIVTSDNPRTENPESIVREIAAGMKQAGNYTLEVDRKAAIEKAINEASPDDLVVIAGKGHEDYQIIGKEKFPFSDVKIAENALAHRR